MDEVRYPEGTVMYGDSFKVLVAVVRVDKDLRLLEFPDGERIWYTLAHLDALRWTDPHPTVEYLNVYPNGIYHGWAEVFGYSTEEHALKCFNAEGGGFTVKKTTTHDGDITWEIVNP